jgi:exodeoxyribonuclease VII small subunit
MKANTPDKSSAATFEQSVKELEALIQKLESDATPLESSIELYEDGLKLIHNCNDLLDQARIRIETVASKATD